MRYNVREKWRKDADNGPAETKFSIADQKFMIIYCGVDGLFGYEMGIRKNGQWIMVMDN
jgi:hypothetical protein